VSRSKLKIILAVSFLIVLNLQSLGLCTTDFFNVCAENFLNDLNKSSSILATENMYNQCPEVYSSLYKENTMRVSIFLGAMNTTSNTCLDRPAKHALIEFLTNDCQSNFFACGFSSKSEDTTTLYKTTDSKTIIVRIHDSSASEDLKKNTTKLADVQLEKSRKVTEEFLKSLEKDNVVFFIGHSRYGTGPGFYHLPILSKGWIVNFFGVSLWPEITDKLRKSSSPPQILGLFSCNSQRYYAREIHSIVPKTAIIAATGITLYNSNITDAISTLDLILANACFQDFESAMNKINPESKHKLYGLFENNSFPKFNIHNRIPSILIFIFILPLIIIIINMFLTTNPSLFEIKYFTKGLVVIFIAVSYSFLTIYYLSKHNYFINSQAIPLFLCFCGFIMLLPLLYKKQIMVTDFFYVIKSSVNYMIPVMIIYLFINIYPDFGLDRFGTSIIQLSKLMLVFSILLPYTVITIGILESPLWSKGKCPLIFRVLLFSLISVIFCAIIGTCTMFFNVYLVPYWKEIFIFLFSMQIISMFLYLYRSSTLLPIVFQSLTYAIIFSENMHGLF